MNERLIKRWHLLTEMLGRAAEDVRATCHYAECMHFVEHNEFELALDVLEDAGRQFQLDRQYWHLLKKSAEVMGLSDRVKELRRMRST